MASSSSPTSKHVMLSYQWDDQELVLRIYEYLKNNKLSVWMDIQGGMKANIYECMAEGVENASVVVCFMTSKYQASANCQRELQFAQAQGVPIVAYRLIGKWKPTGWLGIITAGLLMVDFRDVESNFEEKAEKLLEQILLKCNSEIKPQPGSQANDKHDGTTTNIPKPFQLKDGRLVCGGRICPKCGGCCDWNNRLDGSCKYRRRGGLSGCCGLDPLHGYRDNIPRCFCKPQ